MAMLPLAVGACSAPCAGAVAAVAGGSIAAPVAVVALTTVASVHAAKKMYRSMFASAEDANAEDAESAECTDEEETEQQLQSEVDLAKKDRLVSTVASGTRQQLVVAESSEPSCAAAQGRNFL
mmetsp:Transcript_57766/g.135079  ORF Transcript_57766/g.135079 Transcript_57766/m.135079 type:complete len:123 (+) Transcript_57766:77-445(+)